VGLSPGHSMVFTGRLRFLLQQGSGTHGHKWSRLSIVTPRRFNAWYSLRMRDHWNARAAADPPYKEKSGPKALAARSAFLDLEPKDIMSPSEFREAERILRRLKVEKGTPDVDDSQSHRDEMRLRIERLAAAVLLRYISLERHMVLEVHRDDGYRVRLQVRSVRLHHAGPRGVGLMWSLEGRGLRKNETLGSSREGISFSQARISRRTLTGEWRRLAPVIDLCRRYERRSR